MSVVACFSGGIASGKTTLATAVAEHRQLKLASFGRFVRRVAAARGIPEEGDALQNLGESLIRELSFEGFCRAVIEESQWVSGESLVVDGIRHVNAYDAIKVIVAPVQARLFFVDVPREVRQVRAQNRGRSDRTDLTKADTHSTEKDVHGALKTLADYVLDGTVVLETLIARVENALAANVESS